MAETLERNNSNEEGSGGALTAVLRPGGRRTQVEIISQEQIAKSSFPIFRARVKIKSRETERIRESVFIIKQFPSVLGAQSAVEKHRKLKHAGISTWTTYCAEENGTRVFMTDGEQEEDNLILTGGTDSISRRILNSKQLVTFDRFDEVIEQAIVEVRKANNARLVIGPDSWMTRLAVRDQGVASIYFFAGDTDNVYDFHGAVTDETRSDENYKYLEYGISSLFDEILTQPASRKYKSRMKEILKRALREDHKKRGH